MSKVMSLAELVVWCETNLYAVAGFGKIWSEHLDSEAREVCQALYGDLLGLFEKCHEVGELFSFDEWGASFAKSSLKVRECERDYMNLVEKHRFSFFSEWVQQFRPSIEKGDLRKQAFGFLNEHIRGEA